MPVPRQGWSAPFLPMACVVAAPLAWLAPHVAQQAIVVALLWATLLLAAVDVAWRLASRLLPNASPSVFLLGACLLGEALMAALVTLLGAASIFQLPVVLACLAGIGFLVHRRCGAPRRLADLLGDLASLRAFDRQCTVALLLLLGALAVVALNQVRYTIQDADSMWYHLVMPAEWVRTGSIRPIEAIPSMGAGYPGFRQALLAFLSLAPRNEHLALLGVLEFPLLALSVYGVARGFGARRAIALGAGACAAMTPVVLGSLSTQGNDLSLAIHLLLSVLFVQRFFGAGALAEGLLAGLALGALSAIKFSGPGYAAIVLFTALLQHGVRRWWSWRGLAAASVGSVVLAAPWYLRNLWYFGNPLWPAKLYLGDRVVVEGVYDRAYFQKHMLGWNVQPLLDNLDDFVEAHGHAIVLVAVAPLLMLAAVLSRRVGWRQGLGALSLPVLLFIAFLHHPFNAPWFDAGYTHRYLIAWCCVTTASAAAGLSLLTSARVPWGLVWAASAVVALASVTRLAWPIAGLVVLTTAALSVPRLRERCASVATRLVHLRVPIAIPWLAVAALAFACQTLRQRSQYDPALGYHDGESQRGWAACCRFVHQQVHDRRVGLHGGFFFFPLLGEPWSNQVFVADDMIWLRDFKTTAQVAAWAEARQLDYLVCGRYQSERTASKEWVFAPSIGTELLANYPEQFTKVVEDQGSYVLEVRRTGRR